MKKCEKSFIFDIEEKSLTMLKHYEALKDFIDKGGIKYNCLVILEKPTENFQCNENRKRVVDKNFAKFRCNGLITVAIYIICIPRNLFIIYIIK